MFYRILSCTAAALLCSSVAHASVTRQSGGPTQQVVEASDYLQRSTIMQCDDGWANMQDASVTITVPAGSYELLTARFTAKANAWDINGGTDYGALRIVMGQRELLPADQLGVYTSTIPGYNVPAALDRSIVAAPGLHTVQVQFCVSGTVGAEMDASDWHLTVEAAPVPQR